MENYAAEQAEETNRDLREIMAAHEKFKEEQDSLRRKILEIGERSEKIHASSYDLLACHAPENLDRIAALKREAEPRTVNRREEPEQLADETDE